MRGIRRGLLLAIGAAVLLTFGACGGGTTGTGEFGRTLFIGSIVDPSGAPLSDATVTILESGDSTTTDADGSFSLETTIALGIATLEVAQDEGSAATKIEIPASDLVADLTLTVDVARGEISIVSVSITPREDQPIPSPTPQDSGDDHQPEPTPPAVESVLRGTLLFSDGKPVLGASIILSQTGGRAVTRPDGSFRILFNPAIVGRRLAVSIRYREINDVLTIREIPTESSVITLVISLTGVASESVIISSTRLNAVLDQISIKAR